MVRAMYHTIGIQVVPPLLQRRDHVCVLKCRRRAAVGAAEHQHTAPVHPRRHKAGGTRRCPGTASSSCRGGNGCCGITVAVDQQQQGRQQLELKHPLGAASTARHAQPLRRHTGPQRLAAVRIAAGGRRCAWLAGKALNVQPRRSPEHLLRAAGNAALELQHVLDGRWCTLVRLAARTAITTTCPTGSTSRNSCACSGSCRSLARRLARLRLPVAPLQLTLVGIVIRAIVGVRLLNHFQRVFRKAGRGGHRHCRCVVD